MGRSTESVSSAYQRALLVLCLVLVLPGFAYASYTFSLVGTTATVNPVASTGGPIRIDTVLISGNPYLEWSQDNGATISIDWDDATAGVQMLAAATSSTINLTPTTGVGSSITLGDPISPASDIYALVNLGPPVGAANNDLIIDDSTSTHAAGTYDFYSVLGSITGPGGATGGIHFSSFGPINTYTVKGGPAGNTFNIHSTFNFQTTNTTIIGGTGDTVNVTGDTSPGIGTPLTLTLGAGANTVNIGNAGVLTTINSAVTVTDLGGGASVTVDDSADATGPAVTISGSQVTGASTGAINIGAGVTAVTFNGGTGADTLMVAPSAATTFTLNGGLPTTAPGDTLTVDLTGVTTPVNTPGAPGSGQVTFGNRNPVNYTGIECIPPTAATVGSPQSICEGTTSAGLGGNTPIFGTGLWSVVSGGSGTFNPDAATPAATFTHTSGVGPVTVRWTISSLQCTPSTADVAITIKPTPTTPVATNGGGYYPSQTIHLYASNVAGATYLWTGPLGFTSTDQNPTIPNATVAMSGTYSVIATVNGCDSAAGTTNVAVTPLIPTLSILGLIALLGALGAVGFLLLRKRVVG
jgi:hypothetical protein